MLKKKYLIYCLDLIFILLIIIGGLNVLEKRKYGDLIDSDEVSWIFAGYYFNLYFLQLGFFHPDWKDYEAFDHPPLMKYIVGGALYLKGHTIDSIEPKRLLNNMPKDKARVYFELIKDEIPDPVVMIPWTRSVIFGFALSSLLLIYIFVRTSYGILPALISTSLIMFHPIFNKISAWILAEQVLLFFFTLFLLCCAFYLKTKKNTYIVIALAISSLAFLTKLNGALLVLVLITIFLFKNKFAISKQDWKVWMIGSVVFLLIALLLNPTFINNGIKGIVKMVEVRLSAFRIFQETFKEDALLSVSDRFVTTTKMIFFEYSLFYHFIKIPVELIMFGLGMGYALIKKDPLLLSMFAFLVVIPISILPYNCIKYYYWIFPFTHIIAGLSLNVFKEVWNRGLRTLKAR